MTDTPAQARARQLLSTDEPVGSQSDALWTYVAEVIDIELQWIKKAGLITNHRDRLTLALRHARENAADYAKAHDLDVDVFTAAVEWEVIL
jgi:hypothetical protein